MRLKENEIIQIKQSFESVFQTGKIYLFGSRIDDTKKGGDIDLFLEIEDKTNLFEKKIKFLAKLKIKIGDQKIDVVFNEDENRLIEKEIRKCRIQL
jgi:predicted nucleotidyltransferase